MRPNPALQPTANPLRGLSAAEFGRYALSGGKKIMTIVKEKMKKVIESQPDDATYEAILRELTFERMVERGLADSREGRVISSEEMKHRIRSWQR